MTTSWVCPDLPTEGTDSRCCFANSTCAEFICGHYNSNITIQTTGSLVMHNCLVPNGTEATILYQTLPGNESCSTNRGGNGCIIRTDTSTTTTDTGSSSSQAASTSLPASASASISSSGTSFANPQIAINQLLILGILGLSLMIKKVFH
ncbi:uncharacterized protein I206_101105 [Kwoniella pini CBS 10737]|uniref:Uncharacterized protein n=1 Tax=Kwoniella pini CBS 10737 TaxID=1296096 RepID=A0A1B9IC21_9TREE|nr:uncharacterized protein I206_00221 [Kwoniella pini CBS 10737]OCF52920.1 hypothetical protein I206_00221 [Kwoniella pini CBS 10737]